MVLGIGVDILKMEKLNKEYLTLEDPFMRKTYTLKEYEQAMKWEIPFHYFATRFAGKEAVYKSLNWMGDHIAFHEIEILNHRNGQPFVTLYGKVKEHAIRVGVGEVLISLSFDSEYAIAYAIAQCEKSTIK